MSKPIKTDVTVIILDKEGTATSESLNSIVNNVVMIICGFTGNVDYRTIPSRQTVTFKANNTRSQYFGTFVLDDDLVEVDETFDVYIDPSSLPKYVSLADPCQVTVTIKDDDCEWFCNNKMHLSTILAISKLVLACNV